MLLKALLTSHFRMSSSRWVITPFWLSGSLISFLYCSSIYSFNFLIYYASFISMPFLSFIWPIFAWKYPSLPLIFLSRSLVFPILLFSSISLHWSLRKAFLKICCCYLWNSAFRLVCVSFLFCLLLLFFSKLFLRHPQTTILPFSISFSWGWS